MRKRLLFLSFLEGGAVMAAELCGARQLSPVFGSSLFVWAAVMGITLGALAAGYFFGAQLSEKKQAGYKRLFHVLNISALFVLLMPFTGHYLIPRISYLPFIPGIMLSCMALLFFPVFFLGASSPLFIQVQTNAQYPAGKVSGTVYAISTAGGIFATFLCGFYLIPELGLNLSLICFGGALFVMNTVFFRLIKMPYVFLLILFLYLSSKFVFSESKSLYRSDGVHGLLEVADAYREGNTTRLLMINNIIQTEMNLKTRASSSEYVNLLDTLIPAARPGEKALVLGLGGGLVANMLAGKNYITTGVEFDRRIIGAARQYFNLDERVEAVYADARYFLNRDTATYGVVVFDVFKAEEQPSHVVTIESLQQLKRKLRATSMLFINWHGYNSGEAGSGTMILHNTLKAAGFSVCVMPTGAEEAHRNLIFAAGLNSVVRPGCIGVQENNHLVNTDDLQLLEKHNAQANKLWRNNYLRYYQGTKVPALKN